MGTSGASVAGRAIGISQPRDFASWVFGLPGCAGASFSNRPTADSIILSSSVRVFRLADSRRLDFATDRVSANTPSAPRPIIRTTNSSVGASGTGRLLSISENENPSGTHTCQLLLSTGISAAMDGAARPS